MKKPLFTHVILFFFILLAVSGRAQPNILKDIYPGIISSAPVYLKSYGGYIYFSATDNSNTGFELWRSDGTVSGTQLLADLDTIAGNSSFPRNFTPVNNQLFFIATDSAHGEELWVHNITNNSTSFVKDIYPGSVASQIENMIDFNGTLFFSANDFIHGTELWKSDGTPSGTVMVKNIFPGAGSSIYTPNGGYFAVADSLLYFSAVMGNFGTELWRSNGTASGTFMAADINLSGSSFPQHTTNVNGRIYFRANDGINGVELFVYDGVTANLVQDINPGISSSYPTGGTTTFITINDTVYFCANQGNLPPAVGTELWRTDGTSVGTTLVKDINPNSASSNISSLFVFNNKLLFSAFNGNSAIGTELWISDGTSSGTYLLADLVPNSGSSTPRNFIELGNQVYFIANVGDSLYQTDGTLANTFLLSAGMVQDIVILNNELFFSASNNLYGQELWTFDPGISGVNSIESDLQIYPNPARDKIFVSSSLMIHEISICTISGQLLIRRKTNCIYEEIDIANFPAGVYFLTIITNEGKSSQRIIKQ